MAALRNCVLVRSGALRAKVYMGGLRCTSSNARLWYRSSSDTRPRSFIASGSAAGTDAMYVGDRCSIVTCSAVFAGFGSRVTAVAPLPITTTRLPA